MDLLNTHLEFPIHFLWPQQLACDLRVIKGILYHMKRLYSDVLYLSVWQKVTDTRNDFLGVLGGNYFHKQVRHAA